jgi:hypothetical protein
MCVADGNSDRETVIHYVVVSIVRSGQGTNKSVIADSETEKQRSGWLLR